MKHLIAILCAAAHCLTVSGQLLHTTSKANLYYVDLKDETGIVYAMGTYYDVAATGKTVWDTDTLQKQADGSYTGRHSRVFREENWLYLVSKARKKGRKFQLAAVNDPKLANSHLNSAYYIGNYFAMIRELEEAYPLSNQDWRKGFYTWRALPDKEKEMDYLQFRAFTDARLKEIKDSTTAVHDRYVRLTDYVVQNMPVIDYAALKDSLTQLHVGPGGANAYYGKILDSAVVHRLEYFFRLAEDLPEQQSLLFWYGTHSKQVIRGLKSVNGHEETKKALLKQLKSERGMLYWVIGCYTVAITGLVLLIAHR